MVLPQVIPVTVAGLTEIAILTTWNGPGRLQLPLGPTEEEVIELPGSPTVIVPIGDAALSCAVKPCSVYVTFWLVAPGAKITLPAIIC